MCVLLLAFASWPVGAQDDPDSWRGILQRGSPEHQTEWGLRFEHGEGVAQDRWIARQLYCAAAQRGYALAQYQMGLLYFYGRGVPRDDVMAAGWFSAAARSGDVHAARLLSSLGEPPPGNMPRCGLSGTRGLTKSTGFQDSSLREVRNLVMGLSGEFAVDPELVMLLIQAESNFDATVCSPKNACGLMQLMPETADRFGVRDRFDPYENVRGGMAYLRWLIEYFDGDLSLALAGYNAGEQAVEASGGIPPYAETQTYVAWILDRYGYAWSLSEFGAQSSESVPSSVLASSDCRASESPAGQPETTSRELRQQLC